MTVNSYIQNLWEFGLLCGLISAVINAHFCL